MGLTIFCRHSALVDHIERENEWLREQLIHERQRAEQAIDRLLATRGIGPVTKPTPSEQRAADASMRELLASDEFHRVGEVGE